MMEDLDKKYYKINEVSLLLGIPKPTLRFWETKFTFLSPHRTDKGTRFYTPDDIEKIRMVHYLVKERGFKIEKAEEIIKHNRSGVSKHYNAILRLRKIREELLKLLDAVESGRQVANSVKVKRDSEAIQDN